MNSGVIWIVGLSAAGKTTLASLVVPKLQQLGLPAILLDGDAMSEVLGENSTHSREDRLRVGATYSRLCRLLTSQGVHVVVATVGMIHELHRWNRENLNHYLEVYLDVPIEELRRRDPKKIYERFFAGEITNVAGLDMEVEAPLAPHLHFVYDSNIETLDLAKQIVDAYLVKGGQESE